MTKNFSSELAFLMSIFFRSCDFSIFIKIEIFTFVIFEFYDSRSEINVNRVSFFKKFSSHSSHLRRSTVNVVENYRNLKLQIEIHFENKCKAEQ